MAVADTAGPGGAAKLVKCVVWDLDGTLWDGVLLEDGDVRLRDGARAAVEGLDRRGILQSVASRNDPAAARAALRRFGLDEFFVHPQVGWGAKSEAVRTIAERLNVGLDALLLVDDQAFEREEVAFAHPAVRTAGPGDLRALLARPDLSPATVTADARRRRELVVADIRRDEAEERFDGTSEEFLASLGMVFTVRHAAPADLERAEELTVRTNQLNATGYTYSRDELDALRQAPDHELLVADLEDRLGAYGTIGLALLRRDPDVWTLKLLLTSCRVMARGVGSVLLRLLVHRAAAAGVRLVGEFVATERNRPMRIAYRFAGFVERAGDGAAGLLEHPMAPLPPIPPYVEVHQPPLDAPGTLVTPRTHVRSGGAARPVPRGASSTHVEGADGGDGPGGEVPAVPITDVWADLPGDLREELVRTAHERWEELHAGNPLNPGPWWPLRPGCLTRAQFDHLGAVTVRAARLVLECCRRRASTAGELAELVGMDPTLPMIDTAAPLDDRLITSVRPDVLVVGGVPKLVEVNIDSALGGVKASDILAERFLDLWEPSLDRAGIVLRAPESPTTSRARDVVDALGLAEGDSILLPTFEGFMPGADIPSFVHWLTNLEPSFNELGLRTVVEPVHLLTTDGQGRLLAGGEVVDAILRLCVWDNVPSYDGLWAIDRALRRQTVRMYTPATTAMISSKQVLAWLWSDLDLLDAADRAFVEQHLPYTVAVWPGQEGVGETLRMAEGRRRELVLKTADGYGGYGVVVGRGCEPAVWSQRLHDAATGEHRWVLQDYVPPDEIEMTFVEGATGKRREASVPWVTGPFAFNLRPAGMLLRHGLPGSGDLVNIHLGANANVSLLHGGDGRS